MRNIVLNLLLIGTIFLGSLFFNACDEGYRINTKEMIREEQELIEDYLAENEDSLTQVSVSVKDSMESQGYVFFEMKRGEGDSVTVGKEVGFRYTYYEIVRDSTGKAVLYPYQGNEGSENPASYIVGAPNPRDGIFEGIDLGMRSMKLGSKARMVISSSLWNNDYTPRVADIEVTYLEK
ncbi:MAG: hypothetical protein R6U46_03630 [Marinilabilia sp.]